MFSRFFSSRDKQVKGLTISGESISPPPAKNKCLKMFTLPSLPPPLSLVSSSLVAAHTQLSCVITILSSFINRCARPPWSAGRRSPTSRLASPGLWPHSLALQATLRSVLSLKVGAQANCQFPTEHFNCISPNSISFLNYFSCISHTSCIFLCLSPSRSSGDLLENYCWDDDLMNFSRVLFSISILLTFPIECFVSREVSREEYLRVYP